MKKKVLVTLSFPPSMIANFDSCVEYLESQGFEVVIDPRYRLLNQAELIEQIGGVYAHVASAETVDDAVLKHADSLKIVSRMGIGYDKIDVDALNRKGVALTIAPGANAEPVAEFTASLLMSVTRRIKEIDTATRQGVWKTHFGISALGKTLGIVGLGNIGKKVAKFMSGFDMKVIAFDLYPDKEYAATNNITLMPLDDVIAQSDYLSIHMPYTKDNYRLFGAEKFAMMKKGAIFLNCARGEIVDEAALYSALKSGHLAGAGLDVFEQEPVNMDNPLLMLNNVIVASHTSGMTFEGRKKVIDMAFQNVVDISNGIAPKGLINTQAMGK